jgi:CheY-like chemotaxis protein
MPGMDGFEVLEELIVKFERELTAKIHFLTSSIYYKDKERALINKRVSNFVTKPFTVGKVLSCLSGSSHLYL